MTGFWVFLIFFIVIMAIGLGRRDAIAKGMTGREAAQRSLRYVFFCSLFGLAMSLLISSLGKYSWVIFFISPVGISIWLLSWAIRQQEAGALLLDVGKTSQNKLFFWVGLFQVAGAGFTTWLFSEQVSRGLSQYRSLDTQASILACYWGAAIFFMALGLNKLEFRENGTCFMFSFIAWKRVQSYHWEQSKPNTLTIRFKPRYFRSPGLMSMAILAKHRDAVSHILSERLPDKASDSN